MPTASRPPAADPPASSATWEWMERVASTAPERGLQTLLIDAARQLEAVADARGLSPSDPARWDRMLSDPSRARLATLVRLANALGCEWRVELVPKTEAEEAKPC